jgi:hypothetical protein
MLGPVYCMVEFVVGTVSRRVPSSASSPSGGIREVVVAGNPVFREQGTAVSTNM